MHSEYSKSLIPKSWDVPHEFKRRLGSHVGRQRMFHHDQHILLILHHVPKTGDDGKREPALFWKNPDNQWKSLGRGGGIQALKNHLEDYEKTTERIDDLLDNAETAADYFTIQREITPLLRAVRNMVSVLETLRLEMPEDHAIMALRDRGIRLERSTDLISSDARNGMDFCMAESAEDQAQASRDASEETRRLNRMVAFFFPLATFAAILGMNPPAQVLSSGGIWVILLLGVIAGWVLQKKQALSSSSTGDNRLKLHVSGPRFPFKRKGPPPLSKRDTRKKTTIRPNQSWK